MEILEKYVWEDIFGGFGNWIEMRMDGFDLILKINQVSTTIVNKSLMDYLAIDDSQRRNLLGSSWISQLAMCELHV